MDRKKIINEYSKSEFMNFLEQDNEGLVLNLFNDEGISILKKSKLREDRINYILTFSLYKNELFLNSSFLDVVLATDISYYYATLYSLRDDVCDKMLKRCIELDKDTFMFAKLFSYFDIKYKLKVLDNWPYSTDSLYELLKIDDPQVVQKIISTYNIDLLSHGINLISFFDMAKSANLQARAKRYYGEDDICEIQIPSYMITKDMANKLWENYDIFQIRAVINNAEYCTDFSLVNSVIKKKEEWLINNYNKLGMLSPFKEMYELYRTLKEEEEKVISGIDNDAYYIRRMEFLRLIRGYNFVDYNALNAMYCDHGIEKIYEYFKKLSENSLSNYIIDYLFEENYHNIIIDVRELLGFYYRGNIALPKVRVEIYQRISEIDLLTVEEKLELFNELKKFNMIEIFYDDMAMARYIVGEAIKDYSLTSETIKEYRDLELSKKYGVDVYNMKDNYFFGIVKSGRQKSNRLPQGHSYSLIGNNCLATFGYPEDSTTFLYDADDVNPNQIIHVFPFDSFTKYNPFEYSEKPTTRVNTLFMPDELTKASQAYNEILLLERGDREVGIEDSIPKLRKIALYCLNEIKEKDVEVAKENDVGIILIDSKRCRLDDEYKSNIFQHDLYGYDYFNNMYDREKFESKR